MKSPLCIPAIAVCCLLSVLCAQAEELIFFDASAAPADAWVSENTRVRKKSGDLVVREDHKTDRYGSTYTSKRFLYVPDGTLEINVKQVIAGTYALQVLALKGNELLHTADLVKNSTQTGKKSFPLKFIGLPDETERIAFKIWVADAESACTRFRDLIYSVPVDPARETFSEGFKQSLDWKADHTSWLADSDGARITLKPGAEVGSIEGKTMIPWPSRGLLWIDIAEVGKGDATVQLVAFDLEGDYLQSVDVMRNIGAGTHAVSFDEVPRPPRADRFLLKLWVGGAEGASVVFRQLGIQE